MKRIPIPGTVALLLACLTCMLRAQAPAPPSSPASSELRPANELDLMLGPIALYPDPLLVEMLTAATQPAQLAMANRYVQNGTDGQIIDAHLWESSVKALARFPAVLNWMADNLPWTSAVGEAFALQPADVMDSIQRLRAKARDLGNLQTTPEQEVVNDEGNIEILPTDTDTIYVPNYDPNVVYDNSPPAGGSWVSYGEGFPVGIWLAYDFDWRQRHVFIWPHYHPRPPGWWHLPPGHRPSPVTGGNGGIVWRPHPHPEFTRLTGADRGWKQGASIAPSSGRFRDLPQPAARPSGDAFIGIQSANETRAFSVRGQESRSFAIPGGGGAAGHGGGGAASGGGHTSGGGAGGKTK